MEPSYIAAWAGCNSRSDTPHHALRARRLRLVTNSDTASYTRVPFSVRQAQRVKHHPVSMTLRSADGLSSSHSLLANTLASGSVKSDGFTIGTLAVSYAASSSMPPPKFTRPSRLIINWQTVEFKQRTVSSGPLS